MITAIVSTALYSYAGAATSQTGNEILFDMLLAKSETTRSEIKIDKLFEPAKGKDQGQNLYLSVLNDSVDKPLKDALKVASQEMSLPHSKTGEAVFFSEDEWREVYIDSKTSALSSTLGLSDDSIMLISYQNGMIEFLEDQIENNRFKSELKRESTSSEITERILIPDIEQMELILFGQIDASEYDNARAAVGLPPLSTFAESESVDTSEPISEESSTSSETAVASLDRPPADQSFADDRREFPEIPSSHSSAVLYNPTGLNPLQCESDSNIGDAFDDYLDDLPDVNPFDDFEFPRTADDEDTEYDSSGDDDSHSYETDEDPEFGEEEESDITDEFDDIEPAPGHDWNVTIPCNQIFCIEIEFVDTEDGRGLYKSNDNCVACHMQYMLANMDLLLAKTLTPSKAPGNLMESGKCKKGFLGIKPNINIYPIKKPIPSPQDTNPLFQSTNPFESFMREMNEGYGFGKGDRVDGITRHTVSFNENKTSYSIFSEIDDATAARQRELDLNRDMALLEQDLTMQTQSYKDVSMELERLNSYISSLDQATTDINENACEALRSKKTCE